MQKEEENSQDGTLSETEPAAEERQAPSDAEPEQDEEYSDDPVISQGQVGKVLLLCLLVAVGGMAAALGIFCLSGYFS